MATVNMEAVRQRALELQSRKEDLEAEMEAYYSQIRANNATMTSPLVDPEGFPRADIDVYTVRTARAAIARLRNDHREVVEQISRVLQVVYSELGSSAAALQNGSSNGISYGNGHTQHANTNVALLSRPVLAKVNVVTPGSPAAQAGLERNDFIIEFGSLNGDDSLADVGELVARSEGVELNIVVKRGNTIVSLTLTPRLNWGGRGLLGCHIVPV